MAYLILSNGRILEGERFGAAGEAVGELTFYTDVVGYVSALQSEAHAGRMLVATFPTLGNAGVNEDAFGKKATPAALILRQVCDAPSNFRADHTLDDYLKAQGVPGIAGIDTRALVRLIRAEGPLTARICDTLPEGGQENA